MYFKKRFSVVPILAMACFVLASAVSSQTNPPAAPKASDDPVYKQLRQRSVEDFNGRVATVSGLVFRRDAATFKFNSGEIYFLAPIAGHVVGAVFLGDGVMTLEPPTNIEKQSLSRFSGADVLEDHFSRLVMNFTDQTFEEIKQMPGVQMAATGAQAVRAREVYRDAQSLARKTVHTNYDLLTLAGLSASSASGSFIAFPGGGRFDKLIYLVAPGGIVDVDPEEVALFSYSSASVEIWTAFHLAAEYKSGLASKFHDHRNFDITRHEIQCTIRGTRLIASDKITLRALTSGLRVLSFDLFGSLRVSHVVDEQGHELNFIQEPKEDDPSLGVVLAQAAEPGQTIKLTVQYEGEEALRDSGGGNFILIARTNWYPNNLIFGDRAIFEMTFHYPKEYIFVGTGALAGPEQDEGDLRVAKWTSGETELAVAGFNYGKFIKKQLADSDTGYGLEVYFNKELPDELKDLEMFLDDLGREKIHMTGITGKITTASLADAALNDTQNATRVYTAYFGKLPYSRIAMTQQPAWWFGQAWPTLIYMPYTAFLDTTQRTQLMGAQGGSNSFWRYVGPHETAHQWWGHVIGWNSYHDQWMSEGFAEFSTSLYVQYVRKDMAKFSEFWAEQRKLITDATPFTKGKKPYTVGPISQGYRLDSEKTPNIARAMIYPKGAYVLHMIRMMMFDHRGGGDARFREMMKDFVQTNYNKNISTEDFKHAVEKHMTPQMDVDKNGKMDWFFDEWVDGTDIPAYQVGFQTGSANGGTTLTVSVTQSGVSDQFRMLVPIYADFGKGWTRLGAAKMVGNATVEIPNIPLPQAPKRVTVCALDDVLYTSLENKKH